jgi:hypothetical protein
MSRTFSQPLRRISAAIRAFAFRAVGTVASGWLGSPARKVRATRSAASTQHGVSQRPRPHRLELLPVAKQRRPDLPVFMISAHGDPSTVAMALQAGRTSSSPSRWISRS